MPKVLDAVLGGWQVDVTEIHQPGAPLSFGNIIFNGDIHDIPLPASRQTIERWINTDAGFNRVTGEQLVANIRTFPSRLNGVRANGQTQWNAGVIKNWGIGEHVKAHFRADTFNMLNHPIFDAPNITPDNTAFGQVTSGLSEPKAWQFSLRFSF